MNYKNIWILAFVLMGSTIMAQPVAETKYVTMLETAEEAYNNNDYYNAIEWFDEAYRISRDKSLKLATADLYMMLRDYKRAERAYNIVLRRDRDKEYEDVVLDYADALLYQKMYKEALETLRNLAAMTEVDSLKSAALERIENIENIENLEENIDIVVSVIDGEVNSGSGENSPAFYQEENALYFSSFNRRGTINPEEDEDYHAAIYVSNRDAEGKFKEPMVLDEHINRPGYNSSGVSFSMDGKTMYFTRVLLDNNEIETSTLYRSYRKDNGWAAPQPVDQLNGEYNIKHPYEGELYGNRVLFFTADMAGGYGGTDIYYAEIRGDDFGQPINLGEDINSTADEVTPFYQDGVLYFSSDGYGGLGGLDIFKAEWNGSAFVNMMNMGKSYNSEVDDFYFRMDDGGKNGYLVSNRPHKSKNRFKGSETCCDDIFQMKLEEIVIMLTTEVNSEDGPLDEATVELFDLSSTDTDPIDVKTNLKSSEFNFLLQPNKDYAVVVTREGYLPDTTINFNTVGIIDDYTVRKTVTLEPKPIEEDSGEGETEIVSINEPIRLSNIYYDFDRWDILPDAEDDLAYLKSLMDDYPDMVIELSSHTDSRGVSNYNKTLSQRRADSAKDWLVERGISPERINAVGYGEEVILNRCVNGVRCSDEEHRLNRRTEFKIIEGPETITIKRPKRSTGSLEAEEEYNGSRDFVQDDVPTIRFVEKTIDLGDIVKGQSKEVEFHFVNAGKADLKIEIVTACKCTDLSWPKDPVKPGEQGVISAVFHTEDQELGPVSKTLNIIGNTKPIVVEAKFTSNIIPPSKKM